MAMEDDDTKGEDEVGLEFGIIQGIVEKGRDICEPHHIRECFVRRARGRCHKGHLRKKAKGSRSVKYT